MFQQYPYLYTIVEFFSYGQNCEVVAQGRLAYSDLRISHEVIFEE